MYRETELPAEIFIQFSISHNKWKRIALYASVDMHHVGAPTVTALLYPCLSVNSRVDDDGKYVNVMTFSF